LQQEFITPHCPEQNGLVERGIRIVNISSLTCAETAGSLHQFTNISDHITIALIRDV